MKRKFENETKERIIEITVCLIDENGGAADTNLREIARLAGCSAPNIYNYFESLDDLLNTALVKICEDFNTEFRKKTEKPEANLLIQAIRTYIEYAVDHPGRINIYHFERLNFSISDEANASAMGVMQNISQLIDKATNHELPPERLDKICALLHSFLLGALSEYVTGREEIDHREKYITELTGTCEQLFFTLREIKL